VFFLGERWPRGGGKNAHMSCPVCLEPLAAAREGNVADDALACPNEHNLCARCVCKLVEPSGWCSRRCSGLCFVCPLCRERACVSHVHVLTVMKGSRAKALACFSSPRSLSAWNAREARPPEGGEA
jgi:hypothetical protein